MASKKYLEFQGRSDEDLAGDLASAEREYQQARFDNYTKGLDSPGKIRELRRDIARLKTEVRRREIATQFGDAGRPRKLTRHKRLAAKQA